MAKDLDEMLKKIEEHKKKIISDIDDEKISGLFSEILDGLSQRMEDTRYANNPTKSEILKELEETSKEISDIQKEFDSKSKETDSKSKRFKSNHIQDSE